MNLAFHRNGMEMPSRKDQLSMASWQSKKSSVAARISYLLERKTMSDVMFLVGDLQQQFPCHKLLLGAGSEVFEAMFYGDIPERNEVIVPDISPEGFAVLLEYLYKDQVNLKSEDEAFEAAYAAKKYMINGMLQGCETFLTQNVMLTPETVCGIYEKASMLEMKKLKEICLRYLGKNVMDVIRSKSFNSVSKSTLEDILAIDVMDIESEVELLHALWKWGQEQCKLQQAQCTRENIKILVAELLPYIRFLTVSIQEFNEVSQKYKLLDKSEEIAVLLNIAMPQNPFFKMPFNLSTISKKRSVSNCSRIDVPLRYRYNGNYASFALPTDRNTITLHVDNGLLTVLGIVFVFKSIACYSKSHRNLGITLVGENLNTKGNSCATVYLKPKSSQGQEKYELLLKYPLLISENEDAKLTVAIKGEGVEFLQYVEEEISSQIGDTSIKVVLSSQNKSQREFIIKQILCV